VEVEATGWGSGELRAEGVGGAVAEPEAGAGVGVEVEMGVGDRPWVKESSFRIFCRIGCSAVPSRRSTISTVYQVTDS